jgi:hypothetical protein
MMGWCVEDCPLGAVQGALARGILAANRALQQPAIARRC